VRSGAGRIAIVVGTVAILVVLFLVLRGSNDDKTATPSTTVATTTSSSDSNTTTSATTTTEPTTTAEPPTGPQRIRITVRGGKVQGPRTVTVKQGDRVVLVVRADVSDEVHVHGYDLMKDVAPGAPAQVAFRASIPGRFEVELESHKLQILELEVRP
jgi:heme/copper-type cytochrome/quinol oxidase subunit 2